MAPENIHTPTMEGIWNSGEGGGEVEDSGNSRGERDWTVNQVSWCSSIQYRLKYWSTCWKILSYLLSSSQPCSQGLSSYCPPPGARNKRPWLGLLTFHFDNWEHWWGVLWIETVCLCWIQQIVLCCYWYYPGCLTVLSFMLKFWIISISLFI